MTGMSSNAYRDRTFRAAEVRRILRHAAEIDEATEAPGETGRGHSLEEIERIAGDAGISEEALRRAIAGEVGPPVSAKRSFSLALPPQTLSAEGTARGALDAANHEEIARAIRGAVGVLGDLRPHGHGLRWSSGFTGGRNVQMVIEPAESGRVTVLVHEDLRALRSGLYTATLALSLLLFLPLFGLMKHGAVPYGLLAWPIVAYLAATLHYRKRLADREAQLRTAVAEVLAVTRRARVDAGEEASVRARIHAGEDAEDEGDALEELARKEARSTRT